MKAKIDSDEFAMKINILRTKQESIKKDYTQEEMIELLKRYGIPCSVSYFGEYVKHNIIIRSARGVYQFTTDPVYKGVVETALNSIRKYKLDNIKKLSGKAAKEEEAKKVRECIDYLKELGYLVLKPM